MNDIPPIPDQVPIEATLRQLPPRKLSTQEFEAAKIRVEKSGRIAQDLRPPYSRQRAEEIHLAEIKSEQGQRGKESGYEELLLDTRGYSRERFKVNHVDPQGRVIAEQVVMFYRRLPNDQYEWLLVDGQPVALNADLYDTRLDSHKRAQGIDFRISVVPRISGQGAYTGVASIIEDRAQTQAQAARTQESTLVTQGIQENPKPATGIDFDHLGRTFKLDEANPPSAEQLIIPNIANSNLFEDTDFITTAGYAVAHVYRELVTREMQSPRSFQESQRQIAAGERARKDYADYVAAQLHERQKRGDSRITAGAYRQTGTDQFHFNGEGGATNTHLFYFNKSHVNYRPENKGVNAQDVRAYITLSPHDVDGIQRQFVDLSLRMYDAGIDFSAKAAGPYGVEKRTDNMVFYIAQNNKARADMLIKQFMTERGIGQGHVLAAIPSNQDGLSWAMEPTQEAQAIWREVTGSTARTSYNGFVATMAIPTYLDRLAEAQSRKGNMQTSQLYRQEAQRVRDVIKRHNVSNMLL